MKFDMQDYNPVCADPNAKFIKKYCHKDLVTSEEIQFFNRILCLKFKSPQILFTVMEISKDR